MDQAHFKHPGPLQGVGEDFTSESSKRYCLGLPRAPRAFVTQQTTGYRRFLPLQVELVGDRLCYDRIAGTGAGPDSGWAGRPRDALNMHLMKCNT